MADAHWSRIDWIVVLAALALTIFGLPFLHSASPHFYHKQVQWLMVAVAVLVVVLLIDYEWLLRWAYLFYAVALVMLLAVFLFRPINGAHSWIHHPALPMRIQPAEIMKFALLLVLARHLRHKENQNTLGGLVLPILLTLIPTLLIFKQPDLGSALLLPPMLAAVMFVSGANLLHLGSIAGLGALSAIPMWSHVLRPHQKRRLLAFLYREEYEASEAYQAIMSLIAIGSGGLWGEGLGAGVTTSLDRLPESHNDFIFAIIAEEGGFVAAGVLLILYMVVVLGGYNIALHAREPGARLIATGVASLIGVQVLINIGVVTAILPTTGITLPLVSYGGSSLVITFAMVGLMLNVGARRPIVMRDHFGE